MVLTRAKRKRCVDDTDTHSPPLRRQKQTHVSAIVLHADKARATYEAVETAPGILTPLSLATVDLTTSTTASQTPTKALHATTSVEPHTTARSIISNGSQAFSTIGNCPYDASETSSPCHLSVEPTRWAPEHVYDLYDPEFGSRVCQQYLVSKIRQRYRVTHYGSIAHEYKRGSTPEDVREQWKATLRRMADESDILTDEGSDGEVSEDTKDDSSCSRDWPSTCPG